MSALLFFLPCPISCSLHQCGRHMQPHFPVLTRSVLTFTGLAYCPQLQNPTSLASTINHSFHRSGLPNLRVHGSCQLRSLSHAHLYAPLYTSIPPVPMVVCSLLHFTLQWQVQKFWIIVKHFTIAYLHPSNQEELVHKSWFLVDLKVQGAKTSLLYFFKPNLEDFCLKYIFKHGVSGSQEWQQRFSKTMYFFWQSFAIYLLGLDSCDKYKEKLRTYSGAFYQI
jgi:hypothetical protein